MPVSPGASGMQPRDPCRPWRGTLASGHKPRGGLLALPSLESNPQLSFATRMEDWTCLGQHKRQPEFPVVTRESRRNSRKTTWLPRHPGLPREEHRGFPAPPPLSPFPPPDLDGRVDSPALSGRGSRPSGRTSGRSEEHTSELQSPLNLVCRLLLEKKKKTLELQRQKRQALMMGEAHKGQRLS